MFFIPSPHALCCISSHHIYKCALGHRELQSQDSSAKQQGTFGVTSIYSSGFFSSPKKSCAEEHAKAGVRHASSSPCAAGETQHEASGPAPSAGAPKPLQKNPKTPAKKTPSKTPNFLLHSYFFITSSPGQVQQNFPNTISLQILVLVVCVDSQGKENATCYFTVTAMPWSLSLDLSTKNQLFS